jgi:hypothetical protein
LVQTSVLHWRTSVREPLDDLERGEQSLSGGRYPGLAGYATIFGSLYVEEEAMRLGTSTGRSHELSRWTFPRTIPNPRQTLTVLRQSVSTACLLSPPECISSVSNAESERRKQPTPNSSERKYWEIAILPARETCYHCPGRYRPSVRTERVFGRKRNQRSRKVSCSQLGRIFSMPQPQKGEMRARKRLQPIIGTFSSSTYL